MVIFALGQELLSFTSPKIRVYNNLRFYFCFHLAGISLKSESWNDSGKVSSDVKATLTTDFADLGFLELWERGTSSLIQPPPTKYFFCFEFHQQPPAAWITPACMFAKDQNLNPQHILRSIVRGAIPQFLCRSPIIDAILATQNRL